jgi:hypothetical protein
MIIYVYTYTIDYTSTEQHKNRAFRLDLSGLTRYSPFSVFGQKHEIVSDLTNAGASLTFHMPFNADIMESQDVSKKLKRGVLQ